MKLSQDTSDFLESLLWALPEDHAAHKNGWTVHEFHPEFTAAVDSFLSGFRAFLSQCAELSSNPEADELFDGDGPERSFGGNVYFSLSGHGVGFWDDRDSGRGEALQRALETYAKGRYAFEQIDLAKFKGRIHLAYRTAAFRREYLAKLFPSWSPPSDAPFTEYTFSNGDCEFMAHKSGGKWTRVYGYARNMPGGVKATAATKNPLFLDITAPPPGTFIAGRKRARFVCSEEEQPATA